MVNATFDTAKVLAADQRAVGTTSSGEFVNVSNTCQPTPGAPGGWGAPCGCLWASADDMAKFIQLYFRDDVPAGASPSPSPSPLAEDEVQDEGISTGVIVLLVLLGVGLIGILVVVYIFAVRPSMTKAKAVEGPNV